MSQSPSGAAHETGAQALQDYRNAWSALSHLIGQGRSFSGNERNCFFLNTGDGRFSESASAMDLDLADDGRAIAVLDWNLDGLPDLWLSNRTAPRVRLLLNQSDQESRWLRLRLVGTTSNRDAIGARVTITTSQPRRTMMRTVRAGDGFLSQSSKWLHFGVGDATVERVTVRWPQGRLEDITGAVANGDFEITEGRSVAKPWTPPRLDVLVGGPAQTPVVPETNSSASTRTWIMGRVPLVVADYQIDGASRSTDDFLGQPLLINLWSRSCAPCWSELQNWAEHQQKFADAQCQILALSVDSLAGDTPVGLERIAWPFASGEATEPFVAGLETLQRTLMEWQSDLPVPCSFLLDAKGNLAAIYRGPQAVSDVLRDVALLEASPEQQRQAAVPFPGIWASEVFPSDPISVVNRLEMDNRTQLARDYLERFAERSASGTASLIPWLRKRIDQLATDARWAEMPPLLDQLRRYASEDQLLHRQIAYRLMEGRLWDDALRHFDLALVGQEEDAVLFFNAGLAAVGAQQTRRAIQLFDRSATLQPDDVAVQYQLGGAHETLGDRTSAVEHFSKAYALRPDWPPAANRLAWLLSTSPEASLRDGSRAKQIMEAVCREWQTDSQLHPSLLGTYAAALAECGEFAVAEKVIQQAQKRFGAMKMPQQVTQLEAYARGFAARVPIRITD